MLCNTPVSWGCCVIPMFTLDTSLTIALIYFGALEPEAKASYNPVFRIVAELQRWPEETMTSDKSLGSDQVNSGHGRREYLSDDSMSLYWLCLIKHPLIYVL